MKTNKSRPDKLRLVIATLSLFFAFHNAWAIDIHTAKDQGLVGEANTGYLAAVTSSQTADVRRLIADVNAKRKSQFQKTASKTGATLEQVRARFYELAVQRTKPGNYYQDSNGRWKKK